MTLTYNIVDKLRTGAELTKAEREVHERREMVARHLETLAILEEVRALGGERYAAAEPVS